MSATERYESEMRILGPSIGDGLRKVPTSGVEELKRLVGWDDNEDFSKAHEENPAKKALKGFLRAHRDVMAAVKDAQRGPAINPSSVGA